MFERVNKIFKGVLSMILNRQDIAKELEIKIAMNNDMANAIELWCNMYSNNPPWLDDETKTMGLPGAIANELARLVTIEFKSEISNNELLNKTYQDLISVLRINTEYACAKGGIVFKPYFYNGNIEIDIVQQDNFLPVSYTSTGEITAAVFLETKIVEDKKYTRIEYHEFKDDNYTIKNYAYVKNNTVMMDKSLGKRVNLNSIQEWEDLEEEINVKNAKKPFFSYFKIPQANQIDSNSPLGVSVFAKSTGLIKEADKQYSRILWEFEGTELAIDVSEAVFSRDNEGNLKIPKGKERLFRIYPWEDKENKKNFNPFSPSIRDVNLFNGLNKFLRKIEFNCGLAYGTLSETEDVSKTATEIKASKQRSFSTVKDIQKALQDALKDLIISMSDIAKYYNIPVKDIDIDKDVSFDWDDSIIVDKDTDLESMRNDVVAGILRAELYLAKKYGVSEEEALKMMPKLGDSLKNNPLDSLEE